MCIRDRLYTEVFSGEEMNPVIGSIPGPDSSVADQVMAALRERYKIRDEDLVAAELELVPATQPADVGIDGGLVGSWGQDDKLSAYAATRSLFDLKGTPRETALAYICLLYTSIDNNGMPTSSTSMLRMERNPPMVPPPPTSTFGVWVCHAM